ncbi:hypothetical protein CH274_15345 [Rhodococcus sp. 06-418-5]|uniref:hypothetical protein n=1 Tax=Rhodococcus sp. 06-418-5 TaxID=2022507 RepID=UPI000B9B0E90|nr:hypothetical protein [Rhodococcus sp. 06-418-5]OZC80543.1 hypothetical protein CH274_15345 [Rhodococcus sp. 06-418-5]
MSAFVGSVAGFVLGLLVGQFIRFRRVEIEGRALLKPELDTRPFRSRVLNLALVIMFVVSLGMTVWSTYTQRECNGRYQGSLKNNAAIGTQDRALEVRDDDLRDARDNAEDYLFEELFGGGDVSREQEREALQRYRNAVAGNDAERAVLNAERHDLEQQRRDNPYPEARC